MNNAKKHAHTNTIYVTIKQQHDTLYVEIKDKGIGFDTKAHSSHQSQGLKNLNQRIHLLKGHLHIHSEINEGTNIQFDIPLTK